MALDATSFVTRFPEFAQASSDLVTSRLDEALRSVDAPIWGALADDGQAYLAAHLLGMSPFGQQAGMRVGAGANQTTCYWSTYEDLRRRVGTAFRAVLP
jgi:hypothetical protein